MAGHDDYPLLLVLNRTSGLGSDETLRANLEDILENRQATLTTVETHPQAAQAAADFVAHNQRAAVIAAGAAAP